jgi:rRNA maturation endonuclease Nob1
MRRLRQRRKSRTGHLVCTAVLHSDTDWNRCLACGLVFQHNVDGCPNCGHNCLSKAGLA